MNGSHQTTPPHMAPATRSHYDMNRVRATLVSIGIVMILTQGGCEQSTEPAPKATQAESTPSNDFSQTVIQAPSGVKSPIRTESVTYRVVRGQLSAPGEVALDLKHVAKVSSRIEGQVEQIFVQLGDRVRAGQQLIAIGSLQLDELVQAYLVSKAQAFVAENSYRRTQALRGENIVSERRMVEDRGRYIEAKSKFQHVREKLINMGLTSKDLLELEQGSHSEGHLYLLKAPLSGTVVAQQVVLGQGVSPGMELLEVVDTSQVWIFANLPIELAQRFHIGDHGTILSKGRDPIDATLSYIAPIADKATLTVRVRFDVDNRRGLLKPNEYVDVRLSEESSSTLAVPLSAITMVENRKGVFLKTEQGYRYAPIELGQQGEEWVQVTQGLQEGDQVVVSGVFDLKNALLQETLQGE